MFQPQAPLYLLRWRFDFSDDRPAKYGMWSLPATREEDMASRVNTTGLVRASIEGKEVSSRVVKTIVECDGHDYVVFEWNAAFIGGINPTKGGRHQLLGLKLVTRDLELNVFPTGDVKAIRRSDEHKKINFAAFGK
jgi:hypothetical protein